MTFYTHTFFFPLGTFITHNATSLLSDITRGTSSDYMQLPLEPQKVLNYFLPHTQSYYKTS